MSNYRRSPRKELGMKVLLTRFWFEFDIANPFEYPSGIGRGCGVTAYDYRDALKILDEKVFVDIQRPRIKKQIENVDISTLDAGHVLPNMRLAIYRGSMVSYGFRILKVTSAI